MLWERGEKTSHLTTPPKYWAIYWSGRGLVCYAATRDTIHSWGTILGCPNACTEERIWCQMDGGQEREFLVLNEVKSLEFKYNILTETGVQQPTLHVTIFNMDATCIYECFVCTSLAHRTPEVTSPQKLLFISGTLTFERKTKRERERDTFPISEYFMATWKQFSSPQAIAQVAIYKPAVHCHLGQAHVNFSVHTRSKKPVFQGMSAHPENMWRCNRHYTCMQKSHPCKKQIHVKWPEVWTSALPW